MGPKDNTLNRARGAVEEVAGKVVRAIGDLTGDHKLEVKGEAVEILGQERQERAKLAERIEGTVQEVVGRVKEAAGSLIGDRSTELEGKADALTGQARQEAAK